MHAPLTSVPMRPAAPATQPRWRRVSSLPTSAGPREQPGGFLEPVTSLINHLQRSWSFLDGRFDALPSMSNYVFDAVLLYAALSRDAASAASTREFGADVIPTLLREGRRGRAHNFRASSVNSVRGEPYWRDVRSHDRRARARPEHRRGIAAPRSDRVRIVRRSARRCT